MDVSSDRVARPAAVPTSVLVALAPHATSSHARTAQAPGYQRRRPEATALHRIMRENRATLFSDAAARSASGRGYPRFVVEEFDKYERCSILTYGVVRVYCETCRQSDVVVFSCKGRALCPSCTGRRMADVTTPLVDDVLLTGRYRQWTLRSLNTGETSWTQTIEFQTGHLRGCIKCGRAWEQGLARNQQCGPAKLQRAICA